MNGRTAPALAQLSIFAALVAGATGIGPTAVQAHTAEPAGCSTAGMDWNNHPLFRASLHTSERERGFRSLACKVESVRELQAGDVTIRLTLNALLADGSDQPRRNIRLVEVAQVEAGAVRVINRLFLDSDPLNDDMVFAPQVRSTDRGILLRLSPRHRYIYRIAEGKLFALHAFGWEQGLESAFPPDTRGAST